MVNNFTLTFYLVSKCVLATLKGGDVIRRWQRPMSSVAEHIYMPPNISRLDNNLYLNSSLTNNLDYTVKIHQTLYSETGADFNKPPANPLPPKLG